MERGWPCHFLPPLGARLHRKTAPPDLLDPGCGLLPHHAARETGVGKQVAGIEGCMCVCVCVSARARMRMRFPPPTYLLSTQ